MTPRRLSHDSPRRPASVWLMQRGILALATPALAGWDSRRLRGAESYLRRVSGECPVCLRCRNDGLAPGTRVFKREKTVRIAANIDAKDAKALKARLEAQLASMCGGAWCVVR